MDRLGLLYFSRYVPSSYLSTFVSTHLIVSVLNFSPHNDVRLATAKQSPVLQREGYTQNAFEESGNPIPTMEGACANDLALSTGIN